MPTTKKFPAKELLDLGLPGDHDPEEVTVISDTITGHRRWSVDHALIFRLPDQPPGEAWMVDYSVGATESQDEGPWEGETEVKATLVREVEKLVKVWEPAS